MINIKIADVIPVEHTSGGNALGCLTMVLKIGKIKS